MTPLEKAEMELEEAAIIDTQSGLDGSLTLEEADAEIAAARIRLKSAAVNYAIELKKHNKAETKF